MLKCDDYNYLEVIIIELFYTLIYEAENLSTDCIVSAECCQTAPAKSCWGKTGQQLGVRH